MRSTWFRSTASLAALALAATMAACGGGDDSSDGGGGGGGGDLPECPVDALESVDPADPVEVVVWHTQTARPLDVLDELVAEYNASQDRVVVRLESQGSSFEEIQRRFNEAIPSRDLPALVVVDDTFTQSMADSGVVLPAQSCIDATDDDTSGLLDTAVAYYTIDDVLWPVSANIGNAVLYYNRTHFVRAGLDPDDPPESLAEVREYAEAIAAAGVTPTPLVHEFSTWKTEFWLTGAGSSVVDNDNGRGGDETAAATLDGNPEALELLGFFEGMLDDGLMVAVPATPGQIDQYLAIGSQSASMLIDSSSAATSIEAFLGGELDPDEIGLDDSDIDPSVLAIDAGPFPGLEAGDPTQMGGNAWYLINTVAPEVQAGAWDFSEFLNTVDVQSRLLVGGSYLPYVTAANDDPAAVAYLNGEGGVAGEWLAVANEQVAAIDPAFPGPLIGPYDEFRDLVREAVETMVFGDSSPAEALAQAQEEIDEAITRYNDQNF